MAGVKKKLISQRQALEILHDYYDDLERASLAAIERVLHEEFGIGKARFERFRAHYLGELGAEAERMAGELKQKIRRRIN